MKAQPIRLGYCHEVKKRIPMEGYEVESCIELPVKDGDADYDNAKYKRAWFPTKEGAIGWAKAHLKNDCWGSIPITPYALSPFSEFPSIYHKDYTADSEHVERD